jgi:hypothetical protein
MVDSKGQTVGESLYVRYEMWIRRLESRVNSLVGLSGSFFAARKEVCQDFSTELQSDFRTVLNSIKLGMRAVSDPDAVGTYLNISDETKEFNRKVRTVVRGLTVFFNHLELLNIFKYGLFSYQLFCHKLLRWMVPFLLILCFFSNLYLALFSSLYLSLFAGQCLFYSFAVLGHLKKSLTNRLLIKIPLYFADVNAAILVAWWQYINGKRVVMWQPSER